MTSPKCAGAFWLAVAVGWLSGCSSSTPTTPATNSVVPMTITQIGSTSIVASSSVQSVTITGTNFQPGLTLTVAETGGPTQTFSGTALTNFSPTSFQVAVVFATAGSYAFSVAAPGTTVSTPMTLSVRLPGVMLSSVLPASVVSGGSVQTITVTGANFLSSVVLTVNEIGGSVQTFSGSQLANLTATSFQVGVTFATVGTYNFTVSATSTSNASAPVMVTATAAPMTMVVTSAMPTQALVSSSAQTITVSGTGFTSALTATLTPATGQVQSFAGSQLVNLTAASFQISPVFAAAGTYTLVLTAPGYVASAPYTLQAQGPQLTQFNGAIAFAAPQSVAFEGQGLVSGLFLTVVAPDGTKSTYAGSAISNVSATSLSATIIIPIVGSYSFQVTNPNGSASNVLSSTVPNGNGSGSPQCTPPDSPPYVGNISGQPVPQEVFAEGSTAFGLYATIYEDNTPAVLCGGGLLGACPYVQSTSVTGQCTLAGLNCGCISGGLDVEFQRTSATGTCSVTLGVHDVCGVIGSTTLTFPLPPPSTMPTDTSGLVVLGALISFRSWRRLRR